MLVASGKGEWSSLKETLEDTWTLLDHCRQSHQDRFEIEQGSVFKWYTFENESLCPANAFQGRF